MKITILFVLSICLKTSPTIVDPKQKQKKIESSEEDDSNSIESIKDTQSFEEREVLHGPIHSHKLQHYYKGDKIAFYGTARRKFAIEVLQSYASKAKSAVCSPLSALMPLAKLALGAVNKGKEELLKAIGLNRRRKIKDKYQKLIHELKRLEGVQITLASQIFIDKRYHVRSSFRKYTENIFGSSIEKVNFKDRTEAEDTINSWIAGHTKCKFNYQLNGKEKCVILNAITFNANWEIPFKDSGPKVFYTPKGTVSAQMMHRQGMYNFFDSEELDAQIVEIPYEKNVASFMVILPRARYGVPHLLRQLKRSPNALSRAMMQMQMKFIKVSIPKFTLQTQMNMKSIFQAIGLKRVFSHRSDLKRIVRDEEVAISWAYQATNMIVNEIGTVAVAGTDGQIKILMGSAMEKHVFMANRPFLFFIKALGEQIFTGIYTGKDDSAREDLT